MMVKARLKFVYIADPSRGFAPAPPVGSKGIVIADPSRGFAPCTPSGETFGTVFA
jgi:hypothetical protein